jgi:phage head maturation protease
MKRIVKVVEMIDKGPAWLKDAVHHVAKDAGLKTDDLEMHRLAHSEKAKVNQIDVKERKALKYVSARTQDRDDEIVIPKAIKLDEFRKYAHVLVNHNYSLLPVGSDETIEADDFGIKALTCYADTGEGTLANVVWALVSQGHMKASSIGFVPTAYTKPGDRNWDSVANGLQRDWKEFDKARAEKSISRIVTGGVLLEHSDVSVPCNTDAELITVVKSMHVDEKMLKQLGWESLPDGIAVPRVSNKGLGSMSSEDLRLELGKLIGKQGGASPTELGGARVMDIYEDHFIFSKGSDTFSQGYKVTDMTAELVGEPKQVMRRTIFVTTGDGEAKGFHDESLDKGGSGSGNFGHGGRPGEVGGSGGGGGKSGLSKEKLGEHVDRLTREVMNHPSIYSPNKQEQASNLSSLSKDELYEIVHETMTRDGGTTYGKLSKETRDLPGPKANAIFTAVRTEAIARLQSSGKKKSLDTKAAKDDCERLSESLGRKLTSAARRSEGDSTKEDAVEALAAEKDKLDKELDSADEDLAKQYNDLNRKVNELLASLKGGSSNKNKAEVKVVRPPRSVKILFAPTDHDIMVALMEKAVERALARKTGKVA